MSQPAVSIHPYFKVHPGKLDAAQALMQRFLEKTATEAHCLRYEFTINGEVIFCREAYADADATLAHLANVGDVLAEMLTLSDLLRLEIHGPAGEIEKLKEPLAAQKPDWFVYADGLRK